MNRLVRFYAGEEPDDRKRPISRIQAFTREEIEETHDFIQWLFPLPERSPFNPGAPLLDQETIDEFRRRPELREALARSFRMMLDFYGFEFKDSPAAVVCAEWFGEAASNWLTRGNHNHLRLTRILRSARLLGLEAESRALFRALEGVYATRQGLANITPETFEFWRKAAGREKEGAD